jgi:nucleotide-binding universal stress UspA family protein
MYEKMLVPLDGSKVAEMVVPYAEEVAAKLSSQIILVSVFEPAPTDQERLQQTYLEHIREQMQHDLKDWKPKKEIKVQSRVLMGKPADEILRHANENDIGLIAMTSLGLSPRGPWLLGNIAAKVLRATTKPILLVRTPASEGDLKQKRIVKRILVPLDGSELGAAAIPHSEALCQALGAELVLFQVIEPPPRWSVTEVPYQITETPEEMENIAITYLDEIRKSFKDKGLRVSSATAIGNPADQIIDYAKQNAIDLIAMSTHGRTGIGKWIFGSVTDKVLHAGDTTVFLVPLRK